MRYILTCKNSLIINNSERKFSSSDIYTFLCLRTKNERKKSGEIGREVCKAFIFTYIIDVGVVVSHFLFCFFVFAQHFSARHDNNVSVCICCLLLAISSFRHYSYT